jgi:ankyrin repeat protein
MTEKGANPAEGDYDKRTPLHIAAANGHSHVLNFLVLVGGSIGGLVGR